LQCEVAAEHEPDLDAAEDDEQEQRGDEREFQRRSAAFATPLPRGLLVVIHNGSTTAVEEMHESAIGKESGKVYSRGQVRVNRPIRELLARVRPLMRPQVETHRMRRCVLHLEATTPASS
jgi:hypothetical protein